MDMSVSTFILLQSTINHQLAVGSEQYFSILKALYRATTLIIKLDWNAWHCTLFLCLKIIEYLAFASRLRFQN